MRILVTGASGLVGTAAGNILCQSGHEVLGVVHRHDSSGYFPVRSNDLSEKWDFVEDFDVIVHAAGSLPYTRCSFMDYYRNNTVVMQRLIEFALRKKIKKVIYLSTIGVYGEFRDEHITEESVIHCVAVVYANQCDADPEYAKLMNVQATKTLADHGRRMIFCSSSGVFDGKKGHYKETDVSKLKNCLGLSYTLEDGFERYYHEYLMWL